MMVFGFLSVWGFWSIDVKRHYRNSGFGCFCLWCFRGSGEQKLVSIIGPHWSDNWSRFGLKKWSQKWTHYRPKTFVSTLVLWLSKLFQENISPHCLVDLVLVRCLFGGFCVQVIDTLGGQMWNKYRPYNAYVCCRVRSMSKNCLHA